MEKTGVPQCCESCDKLRRVDGSWELYSYDYCGITGKTIIRKDKVAEWCPKLPEIVKVKEVSRKLTDEEMEEIGKFEAARKTERAKSRKVLRSRNV